MYRERPSRVPGAVLWARDVPAGAQPSRARVLPDGCMDLIWLDGELLVAGPDTVAQLADTGPGASYRALRFAPGGAPAVLGVPAAEITDSRVALADLWPAVRARRLAGRIGVSADPAGALDEAVGRLYHDSPPDPSVSEIVRRARAAEPVTATAAALGISERQLHRRSLAAFGYGPRTLARILRLNRALDQARTGMPYAAVAADSGYADQPHFAREVKALTGVPLSALL